jgi:hypothetical protein
MKNSKNPTRREFITNTGIVATTGFMGESAPVAISAQGGKFVLDHDADIPDTMQLLSYEFRKPWKI